jgi:AcrR family transcriptional regulator
VTRALLEAGAELFAARGPAHVTVRDIAERARVNHGLVHHYFGSKEALLKAVVRDFTSRFAAESITAFDQLFASAGRTDFSRIMARLILDGYDPNEFTGDDPTIRNILAFAEQAKEGGFLREGLDPRLVTAMGFALHLGWLVFEPHLLVATGLAVRGKDRVREQIFRSYLQLILALDHDALGLGQWMQPEHD